MRRRQLKWLWQRLGEPARGNADHARATADEAGCGPRQGTDRLAPDATSPSTRPPASFCPSRSTRTRLRQIRRSAKGAICYAPISPKATPRTLWQYYIQLVAVEEAAKTSKGTSPSDRSSITRNVGIEAHIFIAFLAYCSYITLQRRLPCAGARAERAQRQSEKFAAVQMIDVHVPTTDGRELVLTRYTQPEPELQLLINQLKLQLPPQPPPKITTADQPRQPLP